MSFSNIQLFSESQLETSWLGLEKTLPIYSEYWRKIADDKNMPEIAEDLTFLNKFSKLIKNSNSPYSRDAFDPGHVTGSALIINKDATKVLLTHHRKLEKWLQLGGHSDGSAATPVVAYREATEESGLAEVNLIVLPNQQPVVRTTCVLPFDTDIHLIPARKNEPQHYHFDVRFLVMADENQKVEISEESIDVKWFSLAEARLANGERSMQRQFDKLELFLR